MSFVKTFFAEKVGNVCNTHSENGEYFQKLYFPRIIRLP
jgi:hypothetical protein